MNLKVYATPVSLFLVFCTLLGCSPSGVNKEKIAAIHAKKQIGAEEATAQLIPLIFEYELKEWKITTDPVSKYQLLEVSYGGSSALTFSSQKEYKINTTMLHALYSAKSLFAFSPYPISSIRLSLVKPLYVKDEAHPDVGIQEFEIFRTSMDMAKAKEVLNKHSKTDPFSLEKSEEKDRKVLLEDLVRIWKLELDELNKITVE
ncbi:hypothetical protein [Leptospira ilyithenensis]|uniref:Uncharacterized protein n=1 Tax=Leptospira ilyithenensis TaxID=2484901 RepID=A0A4R9LQL5_9LEPT|nr:hypothetical protein [Leptospira ilyithenensis]TGN10179.1 hypothetical protein EHS11_10465 [Leptospira ilyithenensis]